MNQESSCRDELRNGAVGSLRHFNDGWENNGETKDNTLIMRNNLDEIICERDASLSETDCIKLLNQVSMCNGQEISTDYPRFCPSSNIGYRAESKKGDSLSESPFQLKRCIKL